MLEKPDLPDKRIIACLRDEYGLDSSQVVFLPLGADLNTAVYQIVSKDKKQYFLKLRKGVFDEASVTVPNFLHDLGMRQIIPSLPTKLGQPWANLDVYTLILYPFIEGRNGFEVNLSDQQRVEFGTAVKKFHTAKILPLLTTGVPREQFSPHWRNSVKSFLARIEQETFAEPVARELAVFLRAKQAQTLALVNRADRLAQNLKAKMPPFILCHGDIHGWNMLIDKSGNLYIIDWDTLIFAPKERDLMFVGSGLGGNGHTLPEEETFFYQGYGQTQVNQVALAYYRYERIIEDIAVVCGQIFLTDEGGDDRERMLETVTSSFLPGKTIEIAYQSDRS